MTDIQELHRHFPYFHTARLGKGVMEWFVAAINGIDVKVKSLTEESGVSPCFPKLCGCILVSDWSVF